MENTLKNLAKLRNAQGVALDQVQQKGKTAITMAYLDAGSLALVAGGMEVLATPEGNFWEGPDNFCRVDS